MNIVLYTIILLLIFLIVISLLSIFLFDVYLSETFNSLEKAMEATCSLYSSTSFKYEGSLQTQAGGSDWNQQQYLFVLYTCLATTLLNCTISLKEDKVSNFVPPGSTGLEYVKKNDAIWVMRSIFDEKEVCILSISGTYWNWQWYDDAKFVQKRDPLLFGNSLIHKGFLQVYQSIRQGIIHTLKGVPSNYRIIIAGHSLGAAIATLCYYDLVKNKKMVGLMGYFIASPRVGDPTFARLFNEDMAGQIWWRVVNNSDIVPEVPFPVISKTIVYQHVGELNDNVRWFDINTSTLEGNHTDAYVEYNKSKKNINSEAQLTTQEQDAL